ncbi:MAG TPA: hypothetical protein VFU07_02915 [Candidatus Lumbricidophila sp.]|nr:hypothetical protein [Candidatus Lumbricidophila sp.]
MSQGGPAVGQPADNLGHASTSARVLWSALTIAGGVALAVIPAASVSIAARLFDPAGQGLVAVAVLVAMFVGQLAFAILVESRLSSVGTGRRVVFPRWLAIVGIGVAVILAAMPPSPWMLAIGLPVLVAALEVGRGVSIAEHLDQRELIASVCVGGGALIGVLLGLVHSRWAVAALVIGIAVACVVRAMPVPHTASPADERVRGWVVADTALTGVVLPLVSVLILGALGPIDTVRFTAISTVSGLLAIPLNFMRVRLLKAHSTLDIVVTSTAVAAAVVVLLIANLAGAFGWVFGSAWDPAVLTIPLLIACAWRAASLLTTVPFAALRRAGAARLVTVLRGVVSLLTFGLAVTGVWFGSMIGASGMFPGSLFGALIGLLLAELGSAALYAAAQRRFGDSERFAG